MGPHFWDGSNLMRIYGEVEGISLKNSAWSGVGKMTPVKTMQLVGG